MAAITDGSEGGGRRRRRRLRRSELRLLAFFATFSSLCIFNYLYVSLHLAVQARAFSIVEHVAEARSASEALHHALDAHLEDGRRHDARYADDLLRRRIADLGTLWPQLEAEFSDAPPQVAAFSPGAFMMNAIGFDRPPDRLIAVWRDISDLVEDAELLEVHARICDPACLFEDGSAPHKGEALHLLSADAIGAVTPQLEKLQSAAVDWRDRAAAQTHYAALIALLGVLAIGVLVLTGLAQPLIRRARAARQALALQNELLEVQVATRTSELTQALKRTEVGSRVKSEFLRSLSHEIRTPMNGVIGAAAVMEGMELDESAQNFVTLIRQSSDRMMSYLDNVIEMAELSSAPVVLTPGPVTLDLVLSDLAAEFAGALEAKGVAFIYDVSAMAAPQLEIDGVRLRQIVEALLKNAAAYTECGFVALRVKTTAKSGFCELEIEVEDSGVGIAESEHARIFDRFIRLDQTGENLGAGLGLSICNLLVEAMSGAIEVESTPEEGSLFRVRLSAPISESLEAVA